MSATILAPIYESLTSAEVFAICHIDINDNHGSGRGLRRVKGSIFPILTPYCDFLNSTCDCVSPHVLEAERTEKLQECLELVWIYHLSKMVINVKLVYMMSFGLVIMMNLWNGVAV